MRKSYCLLALLALTLLSGEARAWGDLGHKVICEIAFRLVQPDTQAAINRLIQLDSEYKTFSDSCIYPDHPRIRAAEHFLNLPRDSKGLTSDECPQANVCVLTAILNDFKILQAKGQSDASRSVALKSLGHWVGDIHQPLHVSFLDDRGGNTIRRHGERRGAASPGAVHGGGRMPPAVSKSISVRCVSCRHRSTLDAAALKRFGLKPDAPIASFVKRLRCTKCGGGSVMAERVPASAHDQRRAC